MPLLIFTDKLLTFLCESAQKCIISHKIPQKIFEGWGTGPLLDLTHPTEMGDIPFPDLIPLCT